MTLEQLKAMKEMLEKNNEQLQKDLAAITEEQNNSRDNLADEIVKMMNQIKEITDLINEEKYLSHWYGHIKHEIQYDMIYIEVRYSCGQYYAELKLHDGNFYSPIVWFDFSQQEMSCIKERIKNESDDSLILLLSNKDFILSQIQDFVAEVLKDYNTYQVKINQKAIETLANTKGVIGD